LGFDDDVVDVDAKEYDVSSFGSDVLVLGTFFVALAAVGPAG